MSCCFHTVSCCFHTELLLLSQEVTTAFTLSTAASRRSCCCFHKKLLLLSHCLLLLSWRVAAFTTSCFFHHELLLSLRAASFTTSCFFHYELLLSPRAASLTTSCYSYTTTAALINIFLVQAYFLRLEISYTPTQTPILVQDLLLRANTELNTLLQDLLLAYNIFSANNDNFMLQFLESFPIDNCNLQQCLPRLLQLPQLLP